jgi:hypothetical protein
MLSIMLRAGAASRYDSGSDQMMRLPAAPAPHHWKGEKEEETKERGRE